MTGIVQSLLAELRAAGGALVVAGPDQLKVTAPEPLPDDLMARLRAAKPELLAALNGKKPRIDSSEVAGAAPCRDTSDTASAHREASQALWDAPDWMAFYDERAAIREYDGHHSRAAAEQFAWSELQCEWHRLHGERSPDWQCAGCGKPVSGSPASILPDGARVHDGLACLIAYGKRWRSAATAALVKMGLSKPATVPEDDMAGWSNWGSA